MNYRIILMAERTYRHIPLDKIEVLNSRSRDRKQFLQNVQSIDAVGMRKPIAVTDRSLKRTGLYELVCGEGRYLAHKELGRPTIEAEVLHCDKKTALLISLIENIARVAPGTMAFAHEMKRMHDAGLDYASISRFVCKSAGYVSDYIRLVEQGEERLIKGVEQGLFSISFATMVARSDDGMVQNILMDAFDEGMVNCRNLYRVRQIIDLRFSRGKTPEKRDRGHNRPDYTIKQLKQDITQSTKEKEGFVRETRRKENRLLTLLIGLRALAQDGALQAMLSEEGVGELPKLAGSYEC